MPKIHRNLPWLEKPVAKERLLVAKGNSRKVGTSKERTL